MWMMRRFRHNKEIFTEDGLHQELLDLLREVLVPWGGDYANFFILIYEYIEYMMPL